MISYRDIYPNKKPSSRSTEAVLLDEGFLFGIHNFPFSIYLLWKVIYLHRFAISEHDDILLLFQKKKKKQSEICFATYRDS